MKQLKTLTKKKQYSDIKEYLESLPSVDKGKVFEEYIEYLLNGNGFLAKRVGVSLNYVEISLNCEMRWGIAL